MKKRFNKIYVEITNVCNLHCSFCSKDYLPNKEMSIEEFRVVIAKIKDYTDNVYLHVKGEPLLHRNLDTILDICDENNINVRLTTNGVLLAKVKDILLKHSIKQINVSLHSENNMENYFDSVFNTCDILSKKITIVYRIWIGKQFSNIVNKINKHYNLSAKIVDKNVKIQDNIFIDTDSEFNWPKITSKKSEYGTCLGTKSHIAILSNGNVTPCCLDSKGIITFGNIFEDSLTDIVNTKLFQEINNGFKNNIVVHDLCRCCTYRKRFEK